MQVVPVHINRSVIPSTPQKCWYAVYTRHHHEKKTFELLQKRKIEAYLPLQTTLKQWGDRKKKVSEPFFSCYLFVHITQREYYTVLSLPGTLHYIAFEGKATAIPDKQIQLIKNLLEQDIEIEELSETFQKGARVEIKAGPLTGIEGELLENAGKKRVIIRIEEINKAILVNVPLDFLRLVD